VQALRRPDAAVFAALCATLVMLVAMGISRFTLGTPFIPELITQRIFSLVTPPIFTAVIRLLGFAAKWVAFGFVVVGYIAVGVVLGRLYARLLGHYGRSPSVTSGGLFGIIVWLGLMTLGLPLLGAGAFGIALRQGAVSGAGGLLALHLLYGGLLGEFMRHAMHARRSAVPAWSQAAPRSRRLFLGGLLTWPVMWLSISRFGQSALGTGPRQAAATENSFEALQGLSPEVTPHGKFYTISKNLFDPTIKAQTWTLSVYGTVETPLQFSLDELKALPPYEAYVTFACISNEIGGPLIGNARWKGVSLRTLLDRAKLKADARKVVLRAEDGYSTGIPLERCWRPETFLAYEMNGGPLPARHGFPLRAVIPGYYGMKQPKWLTAIEIVTHDYQGYWEERGWADEAVVKTLSRIDAPAHRSQTPAPGVPIGGIAFAGDRGISMVEYSSDGGTTWQEARLKPALSPYAWTLWMGMSVLPAEGAYLLAVRATDGRGNLQEERVTEPLPDGASGYHKLRVIRKGA
jgi:DMSO/TMAO reductase YedYZ molybdopterin-dependent catalytic subunit